MEYWEFLIQKEGDRSWRPIKSEKLEIEAGRYRVVAHSSRLNTEVEICVIYDSTEELPPRRRSQKRSRRTNPEGLMVVIPFTYLKPGRWELRCCGDVLSDFLGNSWQEAVQLEVLPRATEVLPTLESASPQTKVQEGLSKDLGSSPDLNPVIELTPTANLASNSDSDRVAEPTSIEIEATPVTPVAAEAAVLSEQNSELVIEDGEGRECERKRLGEEFYHSVTSETYELANAELSPDHSTPEVPSFHFDQAEVQPMTLADQVIAPELAELDENTRAISSNSAEAAMLTNPILEESLQKLEQVLQQVLEPVLQEFERPKTLDSAQPETPEPDLASEVETHQSGVILTLAQEALVARRGEPLTIAGHVDVDQLSHREIATALNSVLQGTLRYELRDPQTLQLIVDVQEPLSEQALPFAFSHTLEIPPDCNTRLVLGKATLYGSASTALASQPFSVTADLDELLGAILPGTKAMPLAKMLVLANNNDLTNFQENGAELLADAPPLNQTSLELIDINQNRQTLSLNPSSQKPLPPQLYQPNSTEKGAKALQLPKLPKVQPVITTDLVNLDISNPVEVNQEDTQEQAIALANGFSPETPHQESATIEDATSELELEDMLQWLDDDDSEDDAVTVVESSTSALAVAEASGSQVSAIEPAWDTLKANKTVEDSEATADSPLDTVDVLEALAIDTPTVDSQPSDAQELELEMESAEVPVAETGVNEHTAVDNAFQALNVQDRFWLRLNSLAADAELSHWLNSEISPSRSLAEFEIATQALAPELESPEIEEVTPELEPDPALTEFDEAMWTEEGDELNGDAAAADLNEVSDIDESEQQSAADVAYMNWAAQEIVVDDDDELPVPEKSVVKREVSGTSYLAESPNRKPEVGLVVPQKLEPPLPAPSVFIPTNELPAGEPVTVRVKLPPHPTRLCVKLWVQDRQSRSLLDGPRWLMDLIPDGAGKMEAMTQFIVPFGSVEIRLEAIAVDIDSQRESHKVSVDCVVIPPDLSDFSLDEFET